MLRTFSKIYGLAGLRVGYAVAPEEVVTAIGKVRRAFDVNSAAQEAALASMNAGESRRRPRTPRVSRNWSGSCASTGSIPAGPAVGNFLFAEVGDDARPLFEQLCRKG